MFNMKVLGRCTYADNLLAVCWRSATEKIRTAKLAKLVETNYHASNCRTAACITL